MNDSVGLDAPGGVRRLRRQAVAAGWEIRWDNEFPRGHHLGLRRSGHLMSLTFDENGSLEHCGCWRKDDFAWVNREARTSSRRELDAVRLIQPRAHIGNRGEA